MPNNIKQAAKRLGIIYDGAHWMYTLYLKWNQQVRKYKNRERKTSFGSDNPDRIFYIIGVLHTTGGLFAVVKSVFCHICYAVQKGYIPVVDMENFKSQLSDGTDSGNAWEAYFEQPCGYSLKDIENSKNIIRSATLPFPKGVEIGFNTPINQDFYDRYHELYKKYIRPCRSVKIYLDKKYEMITGGKEKILGVLCRGTDYTERRPSGHPIQPTAAEAFSKAENIMEEYGYQYLFLATEDKKIYDYFKERLGDRLLFSGQKLYDGLGGKQFLSEIPVANYSEKWHNIVDYYATINILAQCNGISTGLTCGSICAYLMAGGYKYVHFWDLGQYA